MRNMPFQIFTRLIPTLAFLWIVTSCCYGQEAQPTKIFERPPQSDWSLDYRIGLGAAQVQPLNTEYISYGSEFSHSVEGVANAINLTHRFDRRWQLQVGAEMMLNATDHFQSIYYWPDKSVQVQSKVEYVTVELKGGYAILAKPRTRLVAQLGIGQSTRWVHFDNVPQPYRPTSDDQPRTSSTSGQRSGLGYHVGIELSQALTPRIYAVGYGALREYDSSNGGPEAFLSATLGLGYRW